MLYLRTFQPSNEMQGKHYYPHCILSGKFPQPIEFSPVTIFYGTNGSGKSTLLNIIAGVLGLEGEEKMRFGQSFIDRYMQACSYTLATDARGIPLRIPAQSRYIKSEDLLFVIKCIQQEEALERDFMYKERQKGKSLAEVKGMFYDGTAAEALKTMAFRQEKYSNGETAMQLLEDDLQPGGLYLLDEPEVSLSLQNQQKLTEKIVELARFFDCQFVIATHSPILLAGLRGTIYNLDPPHARECSWYELENVRYLYDFFRRHENAFDRHE